jgi:hypothetical protein
MTLSLQNRPNPQAPPDPGRAHVMRQDTTAPASCPTACLPGAGESPQRKKASGSGSRCVVLKSLLALADVVRAWPA